MIAATTLHDTVSVKIIQTGIIHFILFPIILIVPLCISDPKIHNGIHNRIVIITGERMK
jgi:hypothetical protein